VPEVARRERLVCSFFMMFIYLREHNESRS
jgi:hypothetical protein